LEIILKSQAETSVIVDIISRLITLVLKTAPANGVANGQVEVHSKLLGVANKISKTKIGAGETDSESVCVVLQALHETVSKYASSSGLVGTCSQASLFIAKIALTSVVLSPKKKKSKKVDPKEAVEKRVCEIYQASIMSFLCQKRTKLSAKFILDFATRYPSLAFQHMVTPLCALIDLERVNGAFQLVEAIRIIKGILTTISTVFIKENQEAVEVVKSLFVGGVAKVIRQLEGKKDRKRIKECVSETWEIVTCKRMKPAADCGAIVAELEKLEELEASSSLAKIKARLAAL
jgi:hypothetical protein